MKEGNQSHNSVYTIFDLVSEFLNQNNKNNYKNNNNNNVITNIIFIEGNSNPFQPCSKDVEPQRRVHETSFS